MRACVVLLFVFLTLVGTSPLIHAQQTAHLLTVHGRLNLCNGRWGAYIWIVGTKRRLPIHWADVEVLDMPKPLIDLLGAFGDYRDIYADFIVEPTTPYKEGEAQEVRIKSASNLVIVENGKVVLMKKNL